MKNRINNWKIILKNFIEVFSLNLYEMNFFTLYNCSVMLDAIFIKNFSEMIGILFDRILIISYHINFLTLLIF